VQVVVETAAVGEALGAFVMQPLANIQAAAVLLWLKYKS